MKLTKKQKRMLFRILLCAFLLVCAALLSRFLLSSAPPLFLFFVYAVPYIVIGYDVVLKAVKNILRGEVFDENFLMLIATLGAMLVGFLPLAEPQFPEAVFVLLFYQVGELFQAIAVGKSRRAIKELMDISPEYAHVLRDGELFTVLPSEASVGETILVKPGERIPLDGRILSGVSTLDTASLTGESVPRDVTVGDTVVSGSINGGGVLEIRVEKRYEDSTVSRVMQLVEDASVRKSKSENFITVFSRYYTPTVVVLALLLAFLPPIFSKNFAVNFAPWLVRALTFLVISCPCALVISVPLSFFGGIGAASRQGILVKGSAYLEALASVDTVVFDKTGTLTVGCFSVDAVVSETYSRDEILHYAASAEQYSTHPMAKAISAASDTVVSASAVKEMAGRGVSALVDGKVILVGNAFFFRENGIEPAVYCGSGSVVHVALDGEYTGYILLRDKPKDGARLAVAGLSEKHIRTVLLSGDRSAVVEETANALGIDMFTGDLLASDKVSHLEALLLAEKKGKKLAFVGDGVNDAPVLAMADVGIAMGALGSDAAIEAADIVLMDDKPEKVIRAIELARRTLTIVRENVAFAIGVKIAVLILGAFGYAPLFLAVFADVGVAVIAILNAMRTLRFGK